MGALGICLVWVASAMAGSSPAPVFVPVERFTLAWTHSIEKVRWEEDYAVIANPDAAQLAVLHALAARVRGSAAGMEPPPDAVLRNGWYTYTPGFKTPAELRLTRSEFTPDYEVCTDNACQPLSNWLPSDDGVTQLTPCSHPEGLQG